MWLRKSGKQADEHAYPERHQPTSRNEVISLVKHDTQNSPCAEPVISETEDTGLATTPDNIWNTEREDFPYFDQSTPPNTTTPDFGRW